MPENNYSIDELLAELRARGSPFGVWQNPSLQ